MGGLGGRLARPKRIAIYQTEEDSMRFLSQLCGCASAAMFLLCAATAPAAADALPAAQYTVDASTGFCAGFNYSISYSKQRSSFPFAAKLPGPT